MKWEPGHQSNDVVDNRGKGGGVSASTAVTLLRLGSMFGWKGVVGAVVLLGAIMVVSSMSSSPTGSDTQVQFVSFVVDDIQATWSRLMPGYRKAELVVFRGTTATACGVESAASGPFYCPADGRVYIDLAFYDALSSQLGAPGDFAEAYVIGHEFGHHLQNLTGTEARAAQGAGQNSDAVKIELQADCYAGVWAHDAAKRGLLEVGDPEEAMNAASRIGDDVLQSQTGKVRPESFTHGTAEQRVRWLKIGFESGDPRQCDTFSAARL
ncbi:MAG: neutral zinc metallopeptidase [Myxococcota bacterium]